MKNKALKVAFSMVVSLSTGFFLFGNAAFAALIYSNTSTPTRVYTPYQLTNATFSGTIQYIKVSGKYYTPTGDNAETISLYYGSGYVDCHTESKKPSEWGFPAFSDGGHFDDLVGVSDVIIGPFSGSACAVNYTGYTGSFLGVSGGYSNSVRIASQDAGANQVIYVYDSNPSGPQPSQIYSFSYSTTTAKATFTGYWNATTTPYISERLTFWQYSYTLGEESREYFTATTTGAFSWTFDFRDPYAWTSGESSTTPIYTSFSLNASLDQYDETNYVFPYGGTIIDNLDATSTTISASVYNASDFTSTPRDLALYPEYECGITSMMGCIKNAAIWLFYPTQNALDSWATLKTTLETKAPIGYFYQVKNNIGGLSATSTAAFSLVIPAHLKTYIFNPFDIGLSSILWFFFIFHFYKRLKHITI